MSDHAMPHALTFDLGLFRDVNDIARSTPLLHPAASGFAEYGVVLFVGLLLVSWWRALPTRRTGGTAAWGSGCLVSERAMRPLTTRLVGVVAESRLRPFVRARPAERAVR